MTIQGPTVGAAPRRTRRPYECLSLLELVRRIVGETDAEALKELHDHRSVFRFRNGLPLLLAEFVAALRESPRAQGMVGRDSAVLDRAYDLTVDKFANLPRDDSGKAGELKTTGPDCRLYFKAAMRLMSEWRSEHPTAGSIEEEMTTAGILQRLVVRHFRLSCLEAGRSADPTRSRYAWLVNGGAIYVRMPVSMPSGGRKAWLEANVGRPDPSRPGERRRVQQVVDELLGVVRHVRFHGETSEIFTSHGQEASPRSLVEEEVSVRRLAHVVGDEKADRIEDQRPAIRILGPGKLRRLILQVFEDLSQDSYEEQRLAAAFGLSKPTFSRFAGSRWRASLSAEPPDLWQNLAETLARHQAFTEAAKGAGVWERVGALLGDGENHQSGSETDA